MNSRKVQVKFSGEILLATYSGCTRRAVNKREFTEASALANCCYQLWVHENLLQDKRKLNQITGRDKFLKVQQENKKTSN